jgi:Glucoamylase and related glycosyl hydrolases
VGRNLITWSNQAAWSRIQDEVRWNKGPPSLAPTEDGFVRRKRPEGEVSEGSFIACTLWLADCQNMQGRSAEARQTLERVLAIRNDLGLLSEEYDVPGRKLPAGIESSCARYHSARLFRAGAATRWRMIRNRARTSRPSATSPARIDAGP